MKLLIFFHQLHLSTIEPLLQTNYHSSVILSLEKFQNFDLIDKQRFAIHAHQINSIDFEKYFIIWRENGIVLDPSQRRNNEWLFMERVPVCAVFDNTGLMSISIVFVALFLFLITSYFNLSVCWDHLIKINHFQILDWTYYLSSIITNCRNFFGLHV